MMKALIGAILAAGKGERLRESAGGLPKPLIELDGHPLLVRQALAMAAAGASPVLAVVNSETARLIEARKVKLPEELKLFVRDTANSMETLFVLGENLPKGHFIMATVDAVLPRPEFQRFTARALELTAPGDRRFDGALGVARWRGDARPLFAAVDSGGLITSLGASETPQVTAGVYLFSTEIFGFVGQARAAGLAAMREFLGYLVRTGMRFAAIELADVVDVDEAADLAAARAMLSARGESGAGGAPSRMQR